MKSHLVLVSVSVVFASAALHGAETKSAAEVRQALLEINDRRVESALERPAVGPGAGMVHRQNGASLFAFAAAYSTPGSRWFHDARLLPALGALVDSMRSGQLPDGLYDVGNLDSPPDTAFILETLCQAQHLLAGDAAGATSAIRERLRAVILKAAEGVRTGGVHTPNHRWHVCAALAHVHRLYPEAKWLARIDDWLGEGIDLDTDGQYAERSPHYTADVVNPALLNLALLLDRPALLEPVRRSLESLLLLLEPNGEIETVQSRRQDQRAGAREFLWANYAPLRALAVRDGNGRFAWAAREIEAGSLAEAMGTFSPNAPLGMVLDFPEFGRELPPVIAPAEHFVRVFPGMSMVRVRHGRTTATFYGGSDARYGLGIGSGLAMNPTFFRLRKGAAVLESVRLTPAFFNTGFFYADSLNTRDRRHELRQTLRVPYHQPLPPERRNPQGDYTLSSDGRYYSKLDFANRPKDFRTLVTTVVMEEKEGGFALEFNVDGHAGVPVTIELAFRPEGTLEGVAPFAAGVAAGGSGAGRGNRGGSRTTDDRSDAFVLREGWGKFTVGEDRIEFGPGVLARSPGRMEGEAYSWVNGSQRAEGKRVYLTGVTPFRHTLMFR